MIERHDQFHRVYRVYYVHSNTPNVCYYENEYNTLEEAESDVLKHLDENPGIPGHYDIVEITNRIVSTIKRQKGESS